MLIWLQLLRIDKITFSAIEEWQFKREFILNYREIIFLDVQIMDQKY